jgi:hypothetical protein
MVTATMMMRNMLAWRAANGIDAIRTRIADEGLEPSDFPHAEKILSMVPMIVRYVRSQYGHTSIGHEEDL